MTRGLTPEHLPYQNTDKPAILNTKLQALLPQFSIAEFANVLARQIKTPI